MQAFAEIGAGAYGYLADASQLATIFQSDLNQAGTQVARNVTLTFQLPAGVRLGEVLGYPATQAGQHGAGVAARLRGRPAGARGGAGGGERRPLGHSVDVSQLKLDYTDMLKNGFVESTASLSAMVTDRQEVVVAKQDKDAMVFAARARSALNTQNAAEALEAGDTAQANALLDQNAFYFEEAAKVAGPQAVQQDIVDQAQLKREFENPADVPAATKSAKRKARIDFGLSGHTY